jgi:hypothetical protein
MTGTNFSSWYRADEGTLYGEVTASNAADSGAQIRRIAELNDGTASNRILFGPAATVNGLRVQYTIGGSNINGTNGQAVESIFPNAKIAVVYKSADYAFSPNGQTPTTSSDSRVALFNKLSIGNAHSDVALGSLNGTIKKLAYYPKRLTNAELQGLTTP